MNLAKRSGWAVLLAGFGIIQVGFGLYDVLIGNFHGAAIDASLVAIVALILLAMAASR